MKRIRHVLSACLVLIGMIAVLFGYLSNGTAYAADPVQDAVQTLEIVSGKSSYVIITPKAASKDVTAAAQELGDAIRKKTGATLTVKSDLLNVASKKSDTEILIGNTNREESL